MRRHVSTLRAACVALAAATLAAPLTPTMAAEGVQKVPKDPPPLSPPPDQKPPKTAPPPKEPPQLPRSEIPRDTPPKEAPPPKSKPPSGDGEAKRQAEQIDRDKKWKNQ